MRLSFLLAILVISIAVYAVLAFAVQDCPIKCEGDVRYYDGYFSSGYCHYRTENCDALDKESGSRFCKYDDVYVKYKNYYCTPEGCKYTTYDQKVEDCGIGGCNNGECIISCDEECDTRDGFYDEPFCKVSSVFRKYRDYYCYRDVCKYTESDRSVEYCPEGCSQGECKGISCPNKCEGDVWNYGASIISGRCIYQKIDCDTKDMETGSRYCKDNDVYVKFIDYYCSEGCKSVVYERKAKECEDSCTEGRWYNLDENTLERRDDCYSYSCTRGKCIQTKTYTSILRQGVSKTLSDIEKQRSVQFNVNASHSLTHEEFTHPKTRLFNGLLFGSNEIVIELPESEIGYLSFYVNNSNQYAPLVITINDEVIYDEVTEPGEYKILINKTVEQAVLRIRSESSSWRFWAPATYDISDIVLKADAILVKRNEFDFIIENNEFDSFLKARITKWARNTDIFINNKIISEGLVDQTLFTPGRNTIMFMPWPNTTSESNAELTIWYTEKAMI